MFPQFMLNSGVIWLADWLGALVFAHTHITQQRTACCVCRHSSFAHARAHTATISYRGRLIFIHCQNDRAGERKSHGLFSLELLVVTGEYVQETRGETNETAKKKRHYFFSRFLKAFGSRGNNNRRFPDIALSFPGSAVICSMQTSYPTFLCYPPIVASRPTLGFSSNPSLPIFHMSFLYDGTRPRSCVCVCVCVPPNRKSLFFFPSWPTSGWRRRVRPGCVAGRSYPSPSSCAL
jgi:hypothetical protein